jgi:hypothetical protein
MRGLVKAWCDLCARTGGGTHGCSDCDGQGFITEHQRAAAERRIVAQLSEAMLAKLAQRREHGEWGHYDPWAAYAALRRESDELWGALDRHSIEPTTETRAAVIAEAADVANYCAMLVDVLSMEGES